MLSSWNQTIGEKDQEKTAIITPFGLFEFNTPSTPNGKLTLHVDASNFAIGAVLHQANNDELEPLCFYSKKMTETQKRYSTYDRELLAIYQAIKHNKYMIEGQEYKIYTDHKPLIFAFKQKTDKTSDRQLRHWSLVDQLILEFAFLRRNSFVAWFFLGIFIDLQCRTLSKWVCVVFKV